MKKSILLLGSVVLALGLTIVTASPLLLTTLVDFEGLDGSLLSLERYGIPVSFPDGVEVVHCSTSTRACLSARSGTNVARGPSSGEFNRKPFVATFSEPQQMVSLYVRHEDSASTEPLTVLATLNAYDSEGRPVGNVSVRFRTEPSRGGAWHPLAVGSGVGTAKISRIVLSGGAEEHGVITNFLLVDDLSFETDPAAPTRVPTPPDTQAPRIEVFSPTPRSVVDFPTVDMRFRVSEDRRLATVEIRVSESTGRELRRGRVCGSVERGICHPTLFETTIGENIGPEEGSYQISIIACDESGNCSTSSVQVTLDLPTPIPEPLIRALKVEISQAISNSWFQPGLPGSPRTYTTAFLIPGKDTVVRYYLVADRTVPDFSALLSVVVWNTDGTSFTRGINPNAGVPSISIRQDPGDVTTHQRNLVNMRTDPTFSRTLNYVIPGDWLANAQTVELRLGGRGGLTQEQFSFMDPVMLGLNIIRVGGYPPRAPTIPTDEQIDNNILNYVRAAYPVSEVRVLSRRSFRWGGPYWGVWVDICDSLVFDLWYEFGGDDAPVRVRSDIPNWAVTLGVANFLRPCAGVAFPPSWSFIDPGNIPDRKGATVATKLFGDTAAHEIGHAIGLVHVSNDHGPPSEAEGGSWERWPHPHGRLGEQSSLGSAFTVTIGVIPNRTVAPSRETDAGQWQLTLVDQCPTSDLSERFPACTLVDNQQPHDFMSYGSSTPTSIGPLTTRAGRWVSLRTYHRIYNAIRFGSINPPLETAALSPDLAPLSDNSIPVNDSLLGRIQTIFQPSPVLAQDPEERVEALMIGGVIEQDGTAHLAPIQRKPLPRSSVYRQQAGPYELELVGDKGEALLTHPFNLTTVVDNPGTKRYIREIVPFVDGARTIVLKLDEQVLLEKEASPNEPLVQVINPNGGEIWESGVQEVSWKAQDADGDPLTFLVQFSPDGGKSWQGVTLVNPGGPSSVELDVSELIPGNKAFVRVTASDGVNTTADLSDEYFSLGTEESPVEGSPTGPGSEAFRTAEKDSSQLPIAVMVVAVLALLTIAVVYVLRRRSAR